MPKSKEILFYPLKTESARRGLYVAIGLLLISPLSLSALVSRMFGTSVTIDEPVHILAGHRHWQCGDFGINPNIRRC
jgi:hypothetical protein